ncbi:MAG: hypothetical protein ACXAD7_04530 [Candidatus Kariarchaeaceae archaeon]|jgi:hypothetical protein
MQFKGVHSDSSIIFLTWEISGIGSFYSSSLDPSIGIDFASERLEDNLICSIVMNTNATIKLKQMNLAVFPRENDTTRIGLVDFSSNISIHEDQIRSKIHNFEKILTYDNFVHICKIILGLSTEYIQERFTLDHFQELEEYLNGLADFSRYAEDNPGIYVRLPSLFTEQVAHPKLLPQAVETIMFDPVAYESSIISEDEAVQNQVGYHLIKWEYNPIWTIQDKVDINEYARKYQWNTDAFKNQDKQLVLTVLPDIHLDQGERYTIKVPVPLINEGNVKLILQIAVVKD